MAILMTVVTFFDVLHTHTCTYMYRGGERFYNVDILILTKWGCL